MKIKQITIRGYKNVDDLTIELNDYNLLAGLDGSGKSNIIEAINIIFNTIRCDNLTYLGNLIRFNSNYPSRKSSTSKSFFFEMIYLDNIDGQDVTVKYTIDLSWSSYPSISYEELAVKLEGSNIYTKYITNTNGKLTFLVDGLPVDDTTIQDITALFDSRKYYTDGYKKDLVDNLQNQCYDFEILTEPKLSELLYYLKSNYEAEFNELVRIIKVIYPTIVKIDVTKKEQRFSTNYNLRLKDNDYSNFTSFSTYPTSTKKIISILSLYTYYNVTNIPLFLVPNIDHNIPSYLYKPLVAALKIIHKNTSFIFSAASEDFINTFDLDDIYVCIDKNILCASKIPPNNLENIGKTIVYSLTTAKDNIDITELTK